MKWIKRGFLAVAIVILFRAYVGSEYVENDHEIGSDWEPFLKHRPTFRYEFRNPAERNLELVPFDKLLPDEQMQLRDYCEIRFGLKNIPQCYVRMDARMI
jgi:hypothetical protein